MGTGSSDQYYMAHRKSVAKAVERATGRKTRWVNGRLCYEGAPGSDQTRWERVPKTYMIAKPTVAIRPGAGDGEPVDPTEGVKSQSGPSLADQLAKLDNF